MNQLTRQPYTHTPSTLGPTVARATEDLQSENLGEIESGTACLVLGHGSLPDSRRLHIFSLVDKQSSWISCVAKSSRKLVTMTAPPGSPGAMAAMEEWQTSGAGVEAVTSLSSGAPPQVSPPVPAPATLASSSEMPLPRASVASGRSPTITSLGSTKSSSRGALTGAVGAADFPVGCSVSALDEMVLRSEESLKSSQVAILEGGQELLVLGHGSEEASRRLQVRSVLTGQEGWISCVAQSGRQLVRLQMVVSPTAAPAALPTPPAAGLDRSDLAAGEASSKPWLRRQVAVHMEDAGPKPYLVDNSLLNAGTEGLSYRFTKDLDDIDTSLTAKWNTIVEGVDEGDGWLRVGDCYLPMSVGGITVLSVEDSPWALNGLRVTEAFPVGSHLCLLESAVLREDENYRSAKITELKREHIVMVAAHGAASRSRRLFVSDPRSGRRGWISFVSQCGKLLVEMVSGPAAASEATELPDAHKSEECSWYCDNQQLRANTDGIGYRYSKDLDDKVAEKTARWGSVVRGIDCGDGWVKVNGMFLPLALNGKQVLLPTTAASKERPSTVPGFTTGDWEYVCIDPQGVIPQSLPDADGLRASAAGAVQPGEIVKIIERGLYEQNLWLCLADGRGWVLEKTIRRHMSAMNEDQKVGKGKELILDPHMDKPVNLLPGPFAFASVVGGPQLLAGTRLEVLRQVLVLMPVSSALEPGKETWMRYFKVADDSEQEGWLPEMKSHYGLKSKGSGTEDRLLMDFKCGFVGENFKGKASCWISVLAKEGVPLLHAPARARTTGRKLQPGDLVEVMDQIVVSGTMGFFRLPDGTYVPREDTSGSKVACDLLVRQKHKWIYVCNDKDGAQVRETPTRHKNKDTKKRLKHRERAIVTEMVEFSGGDSFLKLEGKKGWVPMTKIRGGVKMAPLRAMEEESEEPSMNLPQALLETAMPPGQYLQGPPPAYESFSMPMPCPDQRARTSQIVNVAYTAPAASTVVVSGPYPASSYASAPMPCPASPMHGGYSVTQTAMPMGTVRVSDPTGCMWESRTVQQSAIPIGTIQTPGSWETTRVTQSTTTMNMPGVPGQVLPAPAQVLFERRSSLPLVQPPVIGGASPGTLQGIGLSVDQQAGMPQSSFGLNPAW
eukprot:TRINITY_DN20133_c0_g1_i2.p1 TRINITY_DN20133_c0_g1~~TRINITY_DN20133_c0_g1_i2.p1  ORF type:complete len:1123 (-),score=191.55 TRINITY_DN20133_c0_g1_i2:15-3383(-)